MMEMKALTANDLPYSMVGIAMRNLCFSGTILDILKNDEILPSARVQAVLECGLVGHDVLDALLDRILHETLFRHGCTMDTILNYTGPSPYAPHYADKIREFADAKDCVRVYLWVQMASYLLEDEYGTPRQFDTASTMKHRAELDAEIDAQVIAFAVEILEREGK